MVALSGTVLCLLLAVQEDPAALIAGLDDEAIAVRDRAQRSLFDADDRIRPLLIEASRGNHEGALRARQVLRWFDLRGILPPVLLDPEKRIRADLLSSDPQTRSACYFTTLPRILGGISGGENFQGILRCALDDPDAAIRVRAAKLLEFDADGKAAGIGLDFLKRVDAPEFAALPRSLGLISDIGARIRRRNLARIEDYRELLSSRNHYVQRVGIEGLERLKAWNLIDEVRALLLDSESDVASAAVAFLAASGLQSDPEPYLEVLKKRQDGALQYAARALVRLKAPGAAGLIVEQALKEEGFLRDAPGVLLHEAFELDPRLALSAAREVLERSPPAGRNAPAVLYLTALEIVGSAGDPDQLGTIMAGYRQFEKLNLHVYFGRIPESLAKGIARAAYPDRLEGLLDLCTYHNDARTFALHHADPPLTDTLAKSALPWIPGPALEKSCLRRLRDPNRPVDHRAMAMSLAWYSVKPEERSAEFFETLCALLGDKTVPEALRVRILEMYPWSGLGSASDAALKACARILEDRDDPLRSRLAGNLLEGSPPAFRERVWTALERDEDLPVPGYWSYWAFGQPVELGAGRDRFVRIVAARLRSPKKAVVSAAVSALAQYGPSGLEKDLLGALESGDERLRKEVYGVFQAQPSVLFLPALREVVRAEKDPRVLVAWFPPLIALKDREGLELLLARDFGKQPGIDAFRLHAGALLDRREELKLLEGSPEIIQPPLLSIALESLLRVDPREGEKVLRRRLEHPLSSHRAVAADLIGRTRRTEFLPALRAMAVTESEDARTAALRALGQFDRSIWLPAWRSSLRAGPRGMASTFLDLLLEKTPFELCPDLWPLLRDQSDYDAVYWGLALNACAQPESFRAWDRIAPNPEGHTLNNLAAAGTAAGLRVRVSEGCRPWAERPMGRQGAVTGSAFLKQATVQDTSGRLWRDRYFCVVTSPEEVRILTLEEARDYWRGVLEPR